MKNCLPVVINFRCSSRKIFIMLTNKTYVVAINHAYLRYNISLYVFLTE